MDCSLWGRLKVFGLFEKEDFPKAAFLAYPDKKGPVKMLKTPPYASTCHLVMNNPGQNRVKRLSKEKKWMKEIAAFLKEHSKSIVFLAFPPEYIDFQPFLWEGLKVTPQYTYRLDLSKEVAELEKGMSPERRNDLKRATKDGVEVEAVSDINQVEILIQKTFDRKGKSFDQSFVSKVLQEFANEGNSIAFIAKYKGCFCATSFIIFNSNIAYYIFGGYDSETTHSGAGALTLWEAIKACRERGIKTFDFEGSMLPEVERYFRGFGGEITPYYLVHGSSKAMETLLKFRNPELF
ncbi:GNAT family N-acetyltransferase [bacterium SCSIO 12741]|nr:GNAT family N-acetyltransferase [bacterium SCSIO 12741]